MELPTTELSPDHVEFDLMCSEVEEFEPLPAVPSQPLAPERDAEEESSLDGQILAGLVTP